MSSCILIYFQVHDGYFVHYFAPKGLPVVPKDVIFVIDVSGSMTGTKIKQVMLTVILTHFGLNSCALCTHTA